MLASRGEEIDIDSVNNAVKLIRLVFPQTDAFMFRQPSYANFEMMVKSVSDTTIVDFEEKIKNALRCFY